MVARVDNMREGYRMIAGERSTAYHVRSLTVEHFTALS